MMFSQKINGDEFKNKKYLLIILAMMIIAAVGLSIAGAFQDEDNDEEGKELVVEVKATSTDVEAVSQSYLVSLKPELKENDRIIGRNDATLKIFVYEDYDDVWSATMNENLNRLITAESDDIAFVIRPFIGQTAKSIEGALAVECAGEAGEWQLMRGSIFNAHLKAEKPEKEIEAGQEIYYYAEKIGADKDAFVACLTNNQKSGKIEQLAAEADKYNVQGSPTMFIGDEVVLGARPYEDYTDANGDRVEGLKSLVDRILASVKK